MDKGTETEQVAVKDVGCQATTPPSSPSSPKKKQQRYQSCIIIPDWASEKYKSENGQHWIYSCCIFVDDCDGVSCNHMKLWRLKKKFFFEKSAAQNTMPYASYRPISIMG
jgi:hypothetical protein